MHKHFNRLSESYIISDTARLRLLSLLRWRNVDLLRCDWSDVNLSVGSGDDALLVNQWSCDSRHDLVGGCNIRLSTSDGLSLGGFWTLRLVCSTVEDGVQLIGVVHAKTANWPWIDVVGIATALAEVSRWHDHAVGHRHAVFLLELGQDDWSLRDHADSCAVVDERAVHGGRTSSWNDGGLILRDD